MLTTVQTSVKLNPHIAGNLPTPRQMNWLRYAIADYGITLDLGTVQTVAQASNHITRIQNQINNGSLKKVATPNPVTTPPLNIKDETYYAIILTDTVAIKSFIGRFDSATAKARAIYGDNVKLVTKILPFAKSKAIELRTMLEDDKSILESTSTNEVACDKTTAEITMDTLNALSVDELRQLATDMGVNLGRSKAKNTIIARILA